MTYDQPALFREIDRDEGNVPYAYQDHLGYWTIGRGFLIDKEKGGRLPEEVNDFWLAHIIKGREAELDRRIPWWRQLSDARQRALLNMSYQLGVAGLLRFPAMLRALQAGKNEEAADEAMDSLWARQTPARAARIAEMIRKG